MSLTYQFKDFVNLKLRALLGTFEIAMTWKTQYIHRSHELGMGAYLFETYYLDGGNLKLELAQSYTSVKGSYY